MTACRSLRLHCTSQLTTLRGVTKKRTTKRIEKKVTIFGNRVGNFSVPVEQPASSQVTIPVRRVGFSIPAM